jgi:hypothetical protein
MYLGMSAVWRTRHKGGGMPGFCKQAGCALAFPPCGAYAVSTGAGEDWYTIASLSHLAGHAMFAAAVGEGAGAGAAFADRHAAGIKGSRPLERILAMARRRRSLR